MTAPERQNFPRQVSHRQDIPLPECKMCGGLMSFACGEEAEPGFEIRTFECIRCHAVGQMMAAVNPTAHAVEEAA